MQRPLPDPYLPDIAAPSRRALRIALVTESYPPEINGVAHTVAKVVEGLCTRDHAVQLVRPRQGHLDRPSQREGLEEVLTRSMPIPMYGSLRLGLPFGRTLLRLWTARRPDIVHIATEGPLGWSALRAALALKLPVCSDFRTNFQAYSRFYGAAWLQGPITAYLRSFHNRCHCTMVPTDELRRQLARAGFTSLSVVARGVDTRLFAPHKRSAALRAQWGVGDDEVVALYVGRLAAEKNLDVLLQSFLHLRVRQPRARLVVVGDGPARQAIQARCRQAVFTGFRTGEDLARAYASSDLFLFPSLTETYGNVTPEAMASGLPVVAFNEAAAGQLISHRANGLLAPKNDPAAFCRLAGDLAHDPELRRRLGAQARDKALELDWDSILARIEDLYASTIAKANASALPRVWAQARRI